MNFRMRIDESQCEDELTIQQKTVYELPHSYGVESCVISASMIMILRDVSRRFETMVEMCTPYAPSSSTTTTMIVSNRPLLLLRASYGALVCTSAAAFA